MSLENLQKTRQLEPHETNAKQVCKQLNSIGRSLRDKVSLDIFWLRDESLADTDNLPPPGVIAAEIVEDLEAALEQNWSRCA